MREGREVCYPRPTIDSRYDSAAICPSTLLAQRKYLEFRRYVCIQKPRNISDVRYPPLDFRLVPSCQIIPRAQLKVKGVGNPGAQVRVRAFDVCCYYAWISSGYKPLCHGHYKYTSVYLEQSRGISRQTTSLPLKWLSNLVRVVLSVTVPNYPNSENKSAEPLKNITTPDAYEVHKCNLIWLPDSSP